MFTPLFFSIQADACRSCFFTFECIISQGNCFHGLSVPMLENPFLLSGFHILPFILPIVVSVSFEEGFVVFLLSCFFAVICSYLHVKICSLSITLHLQFSHKLFHPDPFALQIFGVESHKYSRCPMQ